MFSVNLEAIRQNPYMQFNRMRNDTPICRLENGAFAITRYHDVKVVLKNHAVFSSAGISKEACEKTPDFLRYTRGLIGTDKPDHTRLRNFLTKIMTHQHMMGMENTIRKTCQSLLRVVPKNKPFDFVQTIAAPLPIAVIIELLGIDPSIQHEMRRWITTLITWRNLEASPSSHHDINAMFHYLTEVIQQKTKNPQSDFISALVKASVDEGIITASELIAFIRLFLVAGTDTTTHLLGNAMLTLLNHPDIVDALRNNPLAISDFIDEVLRYDGPVLTLTRRVNKDIEMGGVQFQKNDIIFPFIAAANRDERVFLNPEKFDMTRYGRSHLTFGSGIHFCFGSQLARMQAHILFEEIFKMVDFFERVDEEPLIYVDSFFFRGLKQLSIKQFDHT